MTLDYDMACQTVDYNILVLLVQKHAQLVSQRHHIAGDFPHQGLVQVAATLVVCVDGQVFVC